MAATIKIKNSSTAGAAPTSSDLVQGELAVNVTDKRLYTENSGGTVVELGTNPSSITLPDGSASAPTLLHSGDTNTGLFFPAADTVGITTGGSERARVDSSGNLGLGVTPSAWSGTNGGAFQFGGGRSSLYSYSNAITLGSNVYYDTINKYVASGVGASAYQQLAGVHYWLTAPSGTAGNAITFTQAMTLDASGNLFLGATSAGFAEKFRVYGNYSVFDNGTFTGFIGSGSSLGTGTGSDFAIRSSNAIAFLSGGATERARIDSSGNLLVGQTTTGLQAARSFSFQGAGDGSCYVSHSTANASGDSYIQFGYNGTKIGSITQNGTTATAYNTSSDYRLKENIVPMTGALSLVQQLKPCTYNWKSDGSEGQGFIAHELQEVVPECVTGAKDAVDENGNPSYQGIDTSFLVATLTAAIQEQQALIASQSEIITQLQSDVAALKG